MAIVAISSRSFVPEPSTLALALTGSMRSASRGCAAVETGRITSLAVTSGHGVFFRGRTTAGCGSHYPRPPVVRPYLVPERGMSVFWFAAADGRQGDGGAVALLEDVGRCRGCSVPLLGLPRTISSGTRRGKPCKVFNVRSMAIRGQHWRSALVKSPAKAQWCRRWVSAQSGREARRASCAASSEGASRRRLQASASRTFGAADPMMILVRCACGSLASRGQVSPVPEVRRDLANQRAPHRPKPIAPNRAEIVGVSSPL